jgi:hypothetical protein
VDSFAKRNHRVALALRSQFLYSGVAERSARRRYCIGKGGPQLRADTTEGH